ncbi:glutathione S-transferase family protein [Xinfangfangia sp. D13-10-4-6]|uniref:glutathione S-transferase N-terminal domain-containing protein n=1 Tax=Pseudogemmobacter hezensis TaxID=2737662 RepID=UPI0015533709|nr:glutathione S-transferase N-terminal domain-containing protein [Pseudogemmobacter hezensis]NPD16108.1 glutathione S-transferase family protein [Pseudogemmobacter hezensis]
MKVLINTTSPFARLARIALLEKGLGFDEQVVNPWGDDADLLAVNPAARVPAVITDAGTSFSESLLVVLWLEATRPAPSLLDGDKDQIIAKSGLAYGVIEAAVHTMVGRVITDAGFDAAPVGLRRRRSILNGFARLEADPPAWHGGTPDLAVIATVIAWDYVALRFGAAGWLTDFPRIAALSAQLADRPSFAQTAPFV